MKSAKFFITFTFLLAFTICVSAQSSQYPNEIEGFKFFSDGKLKNLKLLFSEKNDIRAIFGDRCDNGCDYNEDWSIGFFYVNKDWFQKFIEGASERIYKPKPEFVGKLSQINFTPKKTILLSESFVTSKELHCHARTAFKVSRYQIRVCSDNERVIYKISDETTEDNKILKGQILSITYLSSGKDNDDIYRLVEQK